ncbi:MAG: 4-hydroxy-tetrahydrodipicolinate synthase [Oscillospiraceae bacterium]|nr:4-hydroxy-tetrahydrodipicolinate synthase [Oscillospiraceae bacterium]
MTKQTIFKGSGVAIITPFKNGLVDYESFGRLIDWQIGNKTDAIVICGTTGESSTLTDDEHKECIQFAVEKTAGRVPVIAGTGSNDTAYMIDLSKHACESGADALLLVAPYYNKSNPKGLIHNFLAVAEATDKPIILYNVPSRTGCNIPISVYKELSKHERIVAVKEANGDIKAIVELAATCGDSLDIYSGNDDHVVPILSVGGIGVISTTANVVPREMHDMVDLWLNGQVKESAAIQLKLFELINNLFIEVNPIPVKTAMGLMGFCTGEVRLPLYEMDEVNKAKLVSSMQKLNLL